LSAGDARRPLGGYPQTIQHHSIYLYPSRREDGFHTKLTLVVRSISDSYEAITSYLLPMTCPPFSSAVQSIKTFSGCRARASRLPALTLLASHLRVSRFCRSITILRDIKMPSHRWWSLEGRVSRGWRDWEGEIERRIMFCLSPYMSLEALTDSFGS
jgi:hypothetical protein